MPVFGIGGLIVVQLVVNAIHGSGYYSTHSNVYAPIGLVLGALVNFVVADRILRPREQPRELVDQKTGQRVMYGSRSTFFFIPAEYWSIVMLLAAVLAIFR